MGDYWKDLTNSLLGYGQQYFTGQQTNQADITKQQILSNTLVTVAKWVAGFLAAALVLGAIFKRNK